MLTQSFKKIYINPYSQEQVDLPKQLDLRAAIMKSKFNDVCPNTR